MNYFENISDLRAHYNVDEKHPLIDVLRYEDVTPIECPKPEALVMNFYKIAFVKNFNGTMEYGNIKYNSTNGVLYFLEPGQKFSCNSTEPWEGFQILIHPDIFKNYLREKNISTYQFFTYDTNESLLLTKEEQDTVCLLMNQAWEEFSHSKDDFSIPIILSYLSTLLQISERFYSRQFSARKTMCNQLSSDFFRLLKSHYGSSSGDIIQPSVALFSEKLNVTPNYLSDTIKHHTGNSALTIIHDFVIEEAKQLLTSTNQSVSEISHTLGFDYSNYFAKLFKKKTNQTPSEYRKSVNSI